MSRASKLRRFARGVRSGLSGNREGERKDEKSVDRREPMDPDPPDTEREELTDEFRRDPAEFVSTTRLNTLDNRSRIKANEGEIDKFDTELERAESELDALESEVDSLQNQRNKRKKSKTASGGTTEGTEDKTIAGFENHLESVGEEFS